MKASTEDLTRGQWLRKGIASAVVGGAACIATSAPPSLADVASPWGPEASNHFRFPESYRIACPELPGTKKIDDTELSGCGNQSWKLA